MSPRAQPPAVRPSKLTRVLPLRERVVEQLLSEIQHGRFPPGERLTEDRLAELLGVSRTPVREALGLLAQRGILDKRSRGGFVVPSPQTKSIDDSYELRRLLEPYAVRSLVARVTDEQLDDIRDALTSLRAAVKSGVPAEVAEANKEMRRRIFSAVDNDALVRAIASVTDHVQLIGLLTLNDRKVQRTVLARHERLYESIAARDAAAAERAALEYLEASRVSAHAALRTSRVR